MFKVIDRLGLFLRNWSISKQILAIIFVMVFVISLIPIIVTCFYSVPVYDDYTFGYYTHKSILEDGSFLKGIIDTNSHFYMNWQGFYTYNFLAGMQLFNIDINLYWISNLSAIFFITFSIFYFFKTILMDIFRSDIFEYLIITIPVYELFIQFIPSISEGIYWMDGSLSLITTSIFVLMTSFLIKYIIRKRSIFFACISILCAVIISGSTPILFVTYILLFFFSSLYLLKSNNKRIALLFIIFIIFSIGLSVSMLSPGNQVRLNTDFSANGWPLFKSIVYAILYSIIKFGTWTNLCFISVIVFLSPILWVIVKRTNYSFRYPLLIFAINYFIYAGRMAVQLFAGGYLGAGRQMNEYYFSFIILMSLSWFYFIGWLSRVKCLKKANINNKRIPVVLLIMTCICFFSGCLNFGLKNTSTFSTTYSLVKGETQLYSLEMMNRIEIYENDEVKNVVVEPLSVYPSFFMDESIKEDDINYWTNASVAKYYNKNSVRLKKVG